MASVEAFRRTRSPQDESSFWQSETKLAVTFFIVGSYLTGAMIQATGSLLDRYVVHRTSKNTIELHYAAESVEFRKQLQDMVDEAFHKPPADQVFNLCQTYSQIRGIDAYIQTMQGRYAFFRGLTIAFTIAGFSFFFKGYWDYQGPPQSPSNKRKTGDHGPAHRKPVHL